MLKNNITPKGSFPDDIDWEVRPGGMLVQKREDDDSDSDSAAAASRGPMIRIDVTHGSAHHEVLLPAHSTFGDLKKYLAQKTGLEADELKLLFRGKEKEDEEQMDMAGVKDNSKVMLLEVPKEREVGELNESTVMVECDAGDNGVESNEVPVDAGEVGVDSPEMLKALAAIDGVRAEVDNLSEGVSALEVALNGSTKVSDKEFAVSTELLMRQLLKLDGIKAEGDARVQRKAEVRRVQNLVDTLDTLKVRNSNMLDNNTNGVISQNSNSVSSNSNAVASQNSNTVSVTTKWETFDSGVGCLTPPPPMPSSTEVTEDWEKFD